MICQFINVRKSFGKTSVLEDVSLQLETGVPYALCGISGSGKTTILRLICGLEKPDSGEILIPAGSRFSYAFQEPRLFDQITVRKNIELVEPNCSVDMLLDQLDLKKAADKFPLELSGGMKKRVSLARALAAEAEIYLIDEPTAGQDTDHSAEILQAIKRYTSHAICIAASHDETFIRDFAARRIILADGKLSVRDNK